MFKKPLILLEKNLKYMHTNTLTNKTTSENNANQIGITINLINFELIRF